MNFIIFFQEKAFENVICQKGDYFVQGEMSWTIKWGNDDKVLWHHMPWQCKID